MFHSVSGGCQAKSTTLPQFAPKPLNVAVTQKSESIEWSSQTGELNYSSQSTLVTYRRNGGADAYRSVQSAEVVQQPVTESAPNNPYSSTILSAIEAQLLRDQADGAATEELQSRLLAGLDGFKQGYGQALEQLGGMAEFTPAIAKEIGQTYDQVLRGIAALAEKYGLAAPEESLAVAAAPPVAAASIAPPAAVATPATDSASLKQQLGRRVLSSALRDIKTLEEYTKVRNQQHGLYGRQTEPSRNTANIQQYGYSVSEQRTFDFNLKTRDGDVVTVTMSAGKSGTANIALDKLGNSELDLGGQQYSDVEFSVDGELDEDELRSINELLSQAGDISEFFFNGDLDSAVQAALMINYDAEEIATFDIHIGKSTTERSLVGNNPVKSAQPIIAGPAAESFFNKMEHAKHFTDTLGQPRSLVADLTEWVAQQTHPQHPWSHYAGDFVRALM